MGPIEWLTAGLLLVTAVYAWLTRKIAKANFEVVNAMREQMIAESRPYVIIRVLVEGIVFRLEIINAGRTMAEKVKLRIDRDFFQFGDRTLNLAAYNAFTGEIESLPPGSCLTFHLATGPNFFAEASSPEKCPSVFSITASYGFLGRRVEETTVIDVRPYFNASVEEDRTASHLKEIKEAIDKAARVIATSK